MKAILVFCAALLFAVLASQAQTAPPQVTLTWVAPTTGPTATGYNVYRYSAACPAQISISTATKLNTSALTALTYVDTAVTRGSTYCYFVTATTATSESGPSGAAQVTITTYLGQNTPNPPPGSPGVTTI